MSLENQTFFTNSSFEEINFASPIPKIIHRIWMVFNPDLTKLSKTYQEYDRILKSLHKDWEFWEWDDAKILNFVHEYYPDFFSIYISYPFPIMRHDSARYLILKQFGGVFIQHSVVFNKPINPLLKNYDLVFSTKFNSSNPFFIDRKQEVANGIIASIPNHPFWQNITNQLKENILAQDPKSNQIMSRTGPIFLSKLIKKYLTQNPVNNIKILDYKYLFPFYANEKNNKNISSNCIMTDDPLNCFNIFEQAFAYTTWNTDWIKKEYNIQTIDLTQLKENKTKPLYDKLFVTNLLRAPERWKKIAKILYDNDIIFEHFNAVDGYNVKITLTDNKTMIHGIDIKHNAYKLEKNVEYKVLCDNKVQPPKTIYLKAKISNLMAANIGTCCTKVLIREEIIRNNYNNTIIFEDDFEPNVNNLLININNFISNLPKYDIAYLNNAAPQKIRFKIHNNFVYAPGNATKWYGDWAYMLSYEGAKKLNGDYHLINPSDEYSRMLASGEITKAGMTSFDAYFATHNFSLLHYGAFTGHNRNSLASSMGCREQHPTSYKYCNQNITLSKSFIINLSEPYLTEISTEFLSQNLSLSNFVTELNLQIKQKELENEKDYLITCDSKKINSFEYNYRGNLEDESNIRDWCNHLMLFNYIKYKEYNSAVFEMNFKLQPNASFILNNYITNISSSFDLLFLDSNLNLINCKNQGLNIFMSLKAINKILSNHEYKDSVIDFYCNIYEQNYLAFNILEKNLEFEIYQLDTNIFVN